MSEFESQELERLLELKEKGNEYFKKKEYESAVREYSESIHLGVHHKSVLATVLSNRAACYLKLEKYEDCKDDCKAVLEIDGSHKKAYYRLAQAEEKLGNYKEAFNDLSRLLHIDSKNTEAVAMMRRIKTRLEKDRQQDSEVNRILQVFTASPSRAEECLRSLIGLCADDVSHALDLYRKGGIKVLGDFIEESLRSGPDTDIGSENTLLALRVLTAASTHDRFVKLGVVLGKNNDELPPPLSETSSPLLDNDRLNWAGICKLLCHSDVNISQAASSLALRVLKCFPAGIEKPFDPEVEAQKKAAIAAERAKRRAEERANFKEEEEEDRPRVEELDDEKEEIENKCENNEEETKETEDTADKKQTRNPEGEVPKSTPIKEYDLFLRRYPAVLVLRGWLKGISCGGEEPCHAPKSLEAFTMASDAFAAFFSEVEDYIGLEKIVDARMEGIEERKLRIGKVRLGKRRAKTHAEWAIAEGAIDILVKLLDSDHTIVRQRAGTCFGRMITALDNDDLLKEHLLKHLIGHDKGELQPGDPLPPIDLCRTRAALEASLFLSRPDVGKWALGKAGGVQQLLLLISTQDSRCQEITAEVLCLAASCDGGSSLLAPIVSTGSIQNLMMSSNPNTRAAAASAMTKLSLQAKALQHDSPEISQMLNVVLEVLKSSANEYRESHNNANDKDKGRSGGNSHTQLVSFSAVDDSMFSKKGTKDFSNSKLIGEGGRALTSTERAVEVLAAMVGKSYVKDELVHGSYRVAASIEYLLALDLDTRSTIAYGVAHILAAITVTNKELHAKALAEKDMSVEQYEQLAELQRVKTKDEDGNEIEEKKEESDTDTESLCRMRIKRIVALDAIPALVRLLSHESKQTKAFAARALRQICIEESVRGQMSQQGGLKACSTVATDEDCEKETRREAAHAIAKALVTTNPNILTEHLRLGCIKPLIFLCKDVDASNLQQFESLMALTNLTSCGPVEQDRFASEKGVIAVHYLMFSDHMMVRRAATEVLCNMATHEKLLKIMRSPDKVRLWLGFCEDWDNEDNVEAIATACAASGTLASSVSDVGVAKALLDEKCGISLVSLLESERVELIHRCLVIVLELINAEDYGTQLATHLLESGIVPVLSNVIKICSSNPDLVDLAKQAALGLSSAISKVDNTVEAEA